MKCPHCLEAFHHQDKEQQFYLGGDADGHWIVFKHICPTCKRFSLTLADCQLYLPPGGGYTIQYVKSASLFRPRGAQRPPPSPDVPKQFAEDYIESCLVLSDSPKASAALSRRCLQHILRDVAKVNPSDLFNEIQEVLASGKLPSHIAESLDAVRNIGNFAAHPIKSKSSGEIVPVENGEAEWNLEAIESLFDYYFVQPAITKRKRDALNAKLKDAGKPPVK